MNRVNLYIAFASWLFATVSLGSAENFQNRPVLSELNEMVEQATMCGYAINERDLVVSRSQNFFPYCGYGQSYFASLQTELEYLPTLYVDHVNGPVNESTNGFRFFTLLTWREAAGLNANGFRRTITQGDNTYGLAQAGDIIGSWLYEDIEAGFSALKWTKWLYYTANGQQKMGSGTQCSCEAAYEECCNNYEAYAWQNTPSTIYRVAAYSCFSVGGWYHWSTERVRQNPPPEICSLPSIPRCIDIYFNIVPFVEYDFFDFDDLGFIDFGFFLYDTTGQFSETTYSMDYIGSDTNPFLLANWTCPMVERSGGFIVSELGLLAKWSFAY